MTATAEATYNPTRVSLPGRMIAFFRANPDEELTLEDITNKFDCVTSNIHTLTAPAREAKLLARDKNTDGDWIYKRGEALPADADPDPLPPTSYRAPWPTKPALVDEDVDPLTVKLETGIPLLTTRTGRPRQDWGDLLRRMEVGQSCALPRTKRSAVRTAIKEHEATGRPERFAVRPLPDKVGFRLWRIE